MNFYYSQIVRIQEECFPKDHIFRQIMQAKRFIDDNFADRINLDQIAGSGNFSKFHFIRRFKTIYGRTPHQYLIGVRIARARRLLKAQKSVTEVCFAVGFESVSSFTGLFKKMVGTTPSAFREQNRQ